MVQNWFMSYVTLEVEIDHGRIVPREPSKLPVKGKGLLTVLESAPEPAPVEKLTPLEAFRALQKSLNLDEPKAQAWMDMVRDARR
jgi:hypothetical protein